MLNLCTVNTRLFEVCFSYLLEMSFLRCVRQFLDISLSTVTCTCTMTGKRVNLGGSYGLEVPCQYSSQGNSLAVKWLSERIAKERKLRMLWPGIKKKKPAAKK